LLYRTYRSARHLAFIVCALLVAALADTAIAAPDTITDVTRHAPPSSSDLNSQLPHQIELLPSPLSPSHEGRRDRLNDPSGIWRRADHVDLLRLALADPDAAPGRGRGTGRVHSWETGEGKSYLIPALEIPAFVVLLNVFDRLAFPDKKKEGKKAYSTNLSTTWEHLRRQNWRFDSDSFEVNQFGHPVEGATMYGLARSSGLNFWQSLLYSHAGSFLWEMAGETSRPSINDFITTGNAGSLLGEALFRMANLALEEGGERPAWQYETVAALTSPPTAFNRLAFGDRFKTVFPNRKPAMFWQVMLGANLDIHATDLAPEASDNDMNAVANFAMAYGLPGKPGYRYRQPLDYFDFELAFRSRLHNPLEAVTVRGLLAGADYHLGDDYLGIWGVYGSYDYINPHLYRVSSTALSLGTTAQYWLAPGVALQGSLLGGVGFGAAGTETEGGDGKGYHYGAVPQALVALGLLFGDRAMLDLTGRGYYHNGSGVDQLIVRGDSGLTVRITGRHGVAVRYSESLRDVKSGADPTRHLSEGTVSLVYTYLGDQKFGAVEWREAAR